MKYILFPIFVFICAYVVISYITLDIFFWNWSEGDRWIQIVITCVVALFSFIAYIEEK